MCYATLAPLLAVAAAAAASSAAAPPTAPPASFGYDVVTVDATASSTPEPFPHFWSKSFGSGHARLTLRGDWRSHLQQAVGDMGLSGVRHHGLFDDDMGVVVGHREYNFSKVVDSWEFQVQNGVTPIVELSFMPAWLAGCSWTDPNGKREGHSNATVNPNGKNKCGATMEYRGITSTPDDWDDWYDLVRATVQTAVAKFGLAEVRKWSFEVRCMTASSPLGEVPMINMISTAVCLHHRTSVLHERFNCSHM